MKKKFMILIEIIIFCILFLQVRSCPNNCLFCLAYQQCITCQNQYYLTINNKCISKSIDNCRIYSQANKCVICQPTFRIDSDGKCIKDISGCIMRDKQSVCKQCGYGTTVNIKGQCLGVFNCVYPQKICGKCRTGYSLVNNVCVHSASDCNKIQTNGLCTQCKDGFVLNGFECINKGSNSIISGNINLIQKCSLYSRNQKECIECQSGYTLFNNLCKSNGQVYTQTLNSANNKIRQSNGKYIDTPSQFIVHQKATFSLSGNHKDDVLDAVTKNKIIDRTLFQGVGSRPDESDNCLIKVPNSLACSVCLDGYYYFNGICKKKTPLCNKFSFKNNKCLECSDSFVLSSNGQCQDPNCLQADYAQCMKCKQGFLLNQQRRCYDPNCLTLKTGFCNSCANGYLLDQNRLCFKLIDGCITYDSLKTKCIQCKNINYALIADGTCKPTSDDRCLQYNITNNFCIRCQDYFALGPKGLCIDLYCRTFVSVHKCQVCNSGYILHPNLSYCYDLNCVLYSNGTCINCAKNYKLQNGFCVQILVGCLNVEPLNQNCSQCMGIYKLVNGSCVFTQNDRCLNNLNGVCISCKPQYALVNGTCVDLLCERETFSNNFYACTKCKPGFNITPSGKCYDQNCFQTINGSCTWCADNFIIGPFGLCVKASIGCLNWDQTARKCLVCYTGYTLLKNGYCQLDANNIIIINNNTTVINGSGNNDGTNTSNNNKNPATNTTANKNSNNNSNTSTNTNNNLTNININPIPSQNQNTTELMINQINNPRPIDPNCKLYDQKNQCTSCVAKYFIRNNKCQMVPDNCKGFNMRSGNCTSCQNGLGVYGAQQFGYDSCVKKNTSPDPNCLIRNLDLFCIKCKPQFFIKTGVCYQADNICKTFNFYGGQCLTCYDGFTLWETKCIQLTKQAKCKTYDFQNVCIQCQNRYYVNQGVCREINANCLTYEMQSGVCLTCVQGFDVLNGVCTKVRQIAPNCLTANALGICTQCKNRYYLDTSSNCKLVSSFCSDYNKLNGVCLSCNDGYKLRSDLGKCVLANSDDNCISFDSTEQCTKCVENYFITRLLKCVKLNPLCDLYNLNSGDCQKCRDGYYLSFKQCIAKFKRQSMDANCLIGDVFNFCITCKNRYFISSGACLKSSDQCRTFNVNTGACQTCYEGFSIQNNDCIQISKINKVSDENCAFFSGILCIKCKDSFYLSYDTSSPKCTRANPLCKTFNQFNGNCYTCINGYTLQQGYCVIIITNSSDTNINTKLNTNTNTNTINSNISSTINIDTNTKANSNVIVKPVVKNYIDVAPLKCKQYDMDLQICVTCYDRYYYNLIQSACVQASKDCKSYDSTNGWCTSCFTGFYLNGTMCIPNTAFNSIKEIPDVLNLIDTKLNCQKYDNNSSRCITCFNGYQLLSTGVCSLQGSNIINDPFCTAVTQRKCVNCLTGYYVDVRTGTCTLKSTLCASFNVFGGECYKCQVGSVLQDGQCFRPALGIDPYCNFYDGAYCYRCVSGYTLQSFVCRKSTG